MFDTFISSSFVHLRKPDAAIFRMAVDVSQTPPEQSLYIDDRKMFVEVAQTFGMQGVHHKSLEETKKQLQLLGLSSQ